MFFQADETRVHRPRNWQWQGNGAENFAIKQGFQVLGSPNWQSADQWTPDDRDAALWSQSDAQQIADAINAKLRPMMPPAEVVEMQPFPDNKRPPTKYV